MSLCLSCGLCCDGTMFQIAAITPEEATRLEGRVRISDDRTNLLQGCRALNGCKCGVYEDRPAACRAFKCLVLSSLEQGLIDEAQAREGIADMMGRRAKVAELIGLEDPRRALEVAREQAVAGTASEELKAALQKLKQGSLLMLMQPKAKPA